MAKVKERYTLEVDDDLLDIENSGSEGDDETNHSNLLKAISGLTGGKRRKVNVRQRTEPVKRVDEFALAQVGQTQKDISENKIKTEDLLKALTQKSGRSDLTTNIKQAKKRGITLNVPLEKPQAEKVLRTSSYVKVKAEISKWNPVVRENRRAEQLFFPLNQPTITTETSETFTSKFTPKTPLEKQISQLLQNSKHVQSKGEELTPAEKEAIASMSLKEALERRKELARIRALQSYQEAKARRQNKIKSKKYHRLLKKEKMKKELEAFESLKESNPEAALGKLEQLDKKRVEERMTLKHKGAGKWAKLQAIRAKYDNNAREALVEQLKVGREIERKMRNSEEMKESESEAEEITNSVEITNNPWLGHNTCNEDQITSGYRKLWEEVNKTKEKQRKMKESDDGIKQTTKERPIHPTSQGTDTLEGEESHSEDSDDSEEDLSEPEEYQDADELDAKEMGNAFSEALDENLERKKTMDDYDRATSPIEKKRKMEDKTQSSCQATVQDVNIDPNKFVTVKTTVLKSSIPEFESPADEADDDRKGNAEDARLMTLAEAFADDDVVDEFKEEKRRIAENSKPKAIDLSLPGWGEWGGTGLKMSRRKKRRFIIKPPPPTIRKDQNQGNLILNEKTNPETQSRLVSEIPYPFTSVAAFESAIRAPVTSTFIPETAARKIAAPKIVTKLGTAIKPMDESALIKVDKNQKLGKETASGKSKNRRKNVISRKTTKKMPVINPSIKK